tara:strand:- start:1764 stop:2180 length:417 start_codon:yes stop_codon:yes gene_type:complete
MARNTETKNIFRNASKNAGSFVRDIIFGKPTQAGERGITREGGLLDKGKEFFKKMQNQEEGYGNARQAYKNYLDSLNMLKTGYQRSSGKVPVGMMTPRMATRVGGAPKATTYENRLGDWNSRMRKFAVQRYYASLGKK